MKRTLPWALFAFYPLIALAALNLLGGPLETYLVAQLAVSSVGEFVVAYWWPFLAATTLCVIAFFVARVFCNRVLPLWHRVLWAAGMVLLSAIVVPAYWWRYSRGA